MKTYLYSVYDRVRKTYGQLIQCDLEAVVLRDLQRLVNTPGTIYSMYPSDLELYCIGSLDLASGKIDQTCCSLLCKLDSLIVPDKKSKE